MDEFGEIYVEYFPRVKRFLFRLCRDDILAEDLTQETFYRALISFRRYDGSCELFTWLAAIAKNLYYKHLRRQNASATFSGLFELFHAQEHAQNPEDAVIKNELDDALRDAVSALLPRYRDVVTLRTYADLSYAQIASCLGISESSARVIFCRSKLMIAEALKKSGSDPR